MAVANLLGGQVRGGAQNDTGRSDSSRGDRAHQPKIGNFHLAVVRDQYVFRLDVAMHQPGPVGRGQAAQHRPKRRHHGIRRHRAAFGEQFAQGATLDELHHQKRVPGVQTLVIDRDQPGVLKPGDRAGFQLEAGQKLGVAGVARIHHFQCDRPIQPDIEATVDRRRTAACDLGLYEVAAIKKGAVHRAIRRIPRPSSGHRAIVGAIAANSRTPPRSRA